MGQFELAAYLFCYGQGNIHFKVGILFGTSLVCRFTGLVGFRSPLRQDREKYRGNWMAACQFLSVPFTAYAVITPSIMISLICFSISLFFIVGSMAVGSALIWELFDRADVAKAYGMLAAWMTAAGIVAPYLLGFILEKTHSFNIAYYIFSGSAFLAGIVAIVLHVREKNLRAYRVNLSDAVPVS